MKKIYLLFFIFISSNIFAQIRFNKRYNFNTNASVICSVIPTDSCYYISGIATDTINPTNNVGNLFSKIDLNGNIVWRKINYGSDSAINTWCNTLTNFNNQFILSGNIVNPNFILGRNQFGIFFFNHSGDFNKINQFALDTLQHTGDSVYFEFSDNNPMIGLDNKNMLFAVGAGYTNSFHWSINTINTWVLKSDSSGNVLWKKIYGDNIYRYATPHLIKKNDSTYLIGVWYNSLNSDNDCIICQTKILQIDSSGNNSSIVYSSPIGIRQLMLEDFMKTSDGGYVYTTNKAWLNPNFNHTIDYKGMVVKLDSNFNEQWRYTSPGDSISTDLDRMNSIIEINDGSIVAVAKEFRPPPKSDSIFHFMSLVKLKQTGQVKWHRLFYYIPYTDSRHEPFVLKQTSDKGFIIGGTTLAYSGALVGEEGWLVKVDSFGCLVPGCQQWDGVEEIKTDSLTLLLYPNPSNDFLNFIVHTSNSALNFSINDLAGTLIVNDKIINDATMMINTKTLSSGIYFLNVIDKNKIIATKKFIVQH